MFNDVREQECKKMQIKVDAGIVSFLKHLLIVISTNNKNENQKIQTVKIKYNVIHLELLQIHFYMQEKWYSTKTGIHVHHVLFYKTEFLIYIPVLSVIKYILSFHIAVV